MRLHTRQSGHALMCTMAFLVIAMFLWMGAFAAVSANVRSAKTIQLQNDRDDGGTRALAWALTLLETGLPPNTPYSCKATLDSGQVFVLSFKKTAGSDFTVSVRPVGAGDVEIPPAPGRFDTATSSIKLVSAAVGAGDLPPQMDLAPEEPDEPSAE